MMRALPLLLGLLGVAGVGAAVASSGAAPRARRLRLAPIAPAGGGFDLATNGEKFADPWEQQHPSGPMEPYPNIPGREYLRKVPASAGARVDAMLNLRVYGSPGLQPLKQIDELVTESIRLGDAMAAKNEKTRQDMNGYIKRVGAAFGPAGIAAAYLWTSLSDAFAPLIATTGASARFRSLVGDDIAELEATLKTTAERGYPFPLHLASYAPRATDDEKFIRPRVATMRETAVRNLTRTHALPDEDKARLRAWWAMLLDRIGKDATVEKVARSMHGGEWGGLFNLASDEQVVLVAAPICSTWNLNLRDFSMRLWERNGGWSTSPALLRRDDLRDLRNRTATNAAEVQLATLVRDALELAGR